MFGVGEMKDGGRFEEVVSVNLDGAWSCFKKVADGESKQKDNGVPQMWEDLGKQGNIINALDIKSTFNYLISFYSCVFFFF